MARILFARAKEESIDLAARLTRDHDLIEVYTPKEFISLVDIMQQLDTNKFNSLRNTISFVILDGSLFGNKRLTKGDYLRAAIYPLSAIEKPTILLERAHIIEEIRESEFVQTMRLITKPYDAQLVAAYTNVHLEDSARPQDRLHK